MFGDRPALSPPEIFYQRMLAGDPTEAAEMAEEFLKERSLSAYMEDVALRGLLLAKDDLSDGKLDDERMERIRTTIEALCEDFENIEDKLPSNGSSTNDAEAGAALDATPNQLDQECPIVDRQSLPSPWSAERSVLCIGGNTILDYAAAMLFARVLEAHGLNTGAASFDQAKRSGGMMSNCALICLSYLGDARDAQIRFAVRQLSRAAPGVPIVVGFWSCESDHIKPASTSLSYQTVRTFREGTAYCVRQAMADQATVRALDRTLETTVIAEAS
jgi:hypothetical protein